MPNYLELIILFLCQERKSSKLVRCLTNNDTRVQRCLLHKSPVTFLQHQSDPTRHHNLNETSQGDGSKSYVQYSVSALCAPYPGSDGIGLSCPEGSVVYTVEMYTPNVGW